MAAASSTAYSQFSTVKVLHAVQICTAVIQDLCISMNVISVLKIFVLSATKPGYFSVNVTEHNYSFSSVYSRGQYAYIHFHSLTYFSNLCIGLFSFSLFYRAFCFSEFICNCFKLFFSTVTR